MDGAKTEPLIQVIVNSDRFGCVATNAFASAMALSAVGTSLMPPKSSNRIRWPPRWMKRVRPVPSGVLIEDVAHFPQQGGRREGFLQERNAGLLHAVLDDAVLGIPRHEQQGHLGAGGAERL